MKKLILILLLPFAVLGAELDANVEAPSVEKTISIWQLLIPVIVPMIIAGLKAVIPKLPTRLIPFLAPVLGALIDVLLNLADLGGGMGLLGAIFGSAGVGVREKIDQARKTSPEPS